MRRRHIGIVFQFFNLLEGMSVLENVTLPAVIAGRAAQAGRDAGPRPARPARPRRQGEGRARRAVGWSAPAARHRARARQRADAAARRRAHRRARLRGRPRGARAVPPPARRRPDHPAWSPTTTTSPPPPTASCACATAASEDDDAADSVAGTFGRLMSAGAADTHRGSLTVAAETGAPPEPAADRLGSPSLPRLDVPRVQPPRSVVRRPRGRP